MKTIRIPLIFAAFALILTAAYFLPTLGGDKYLQSGDHGVAALIQKHHSLAPLYHEGWTRSYGLGMPTGVIGPSLAILIAKIFPASFAHSAMLAVPLFLFALFAFLFFRRRLGSDPAAALSAVVMAFAPLHVSFVHAGHLGKLGSIAFFPMVLYFLDRSFTEKRRALSLALAGFGLGLAFIQGETPVTLYFAVLATAWYLWRTFAVEPGEARRKIRTVVLFALVPLATLPFSADVFFSQYFGIARSKTAGESVPTLPQTQKAEGGWDWATQWSFPPEETPDLLVGDLFGVKTGDRDKPYWGRTGQQPGWTPENRQGMQNLSQTSTALGLFLVLFALYAMIRVRNREVWFWAAVALVSLLLAFGRHFPLYTVLYHLPFLDKFRNPNRFLHLVHFASAILAGYGIKAFWDDLKARAWNGAPGAKGPLLWKLLPWIVAGATLLSLILIGLNKTALQGWLEARWGMDNAERMAGNLTSALWVFLFLFPLAWGLVAAAEKWGGKTPVRAGFFFGLILLAALLDQARLNAPYFEWFPAGNRFQVDNLSTQLATLAKKEPFRLRYVNQGNGPYLWLHMNEQVVIADLETMDSPPASRMADDLFTFLSRIQNFLLYGQFWNARILLADQPYFSVGAGPQPGMPTLVGQYPDPYGRGAFVYIYEDTNAAPRAYVVHDALHASTVDEVFGAFRNPGFSPRKQVVLTHTLEKDELATRFPPREGRTNLSSTATVLKHTHHEVIIKVSAAAKGMLVLSDGYHGSWKATVDGVETPVHRAQYLMRGLYVEAGEHTVRFYFKSNPVWPVVGAISWGLFAALLFLFFWNRNKKDVAAA